jgi:transcriptional regulator with XRE-family HTH domain
MSGPGINRRIGAQVHRLRSARGWSIDALAQATAVSRSMISLIERGESSPTAVVLEKLASGLGIPLSDLFDPPAAPTAPVSRRAAQSAWTDPASGYVRRNVSPAGSPLRLVEVRFPAGAHVAYESPPRPTGLTQLVWLLSGALDLTVGEPAQSWRLAPGDCLQHTLDHPVAFHNPGPKPARYAVVIGAAASPGIALP